MSSLDADRVAEIQAEIAEIDTALSHLRKGGQRYRIETATGGGSKREVEMADYDVLVKHRERLREELRILNNERPFRIRPNW